MMLAVLRRQARIVFGSTFTCGSRSRTTPARRRRDGQPWFYQRLALGAALWLCWVVRGSIGCPVRLGPSADAWPNPAWILTLEPEPSARTTSRKEIRSVLSLRAQTACGFRYSASNGSPFFHTCRVMAAILRA